MRRLLFALVFVFCFFAMLSPAQLNRNYFYYMGQTYLIDNRYEDAIETLNVLIKADPKAYEAYFLRGIAKYNLDDLLGAEADFSSAIEYNPVYTMAFNYRAITRSRLGNYDDALKDFQEAIDLRPDMPGPYYSRGVTYLLSQQFDKAIVDFDEFIRQNPKVNDAYINRGISYLYQKDTLRAMEDFNTAISVNRDAPGGYNQRGALYMEQNEYDKALEDFNMAIEKDTTYAQAYFNRAVAYANKEMPVQAIEDFNHVIELDPTSAVSYFNRAIVRSQIGDYNRALEDYNIVAEYSPNNVLVYYNRAGLHAYLGDYRAAIDDYSKAIELYPDFANAYLYRSNMRYMVNDQRGSRDDREVAELKIAEYRTKVADSTFSIYADTSRRFNQLLAFDTRISGTNINRMSDQGENVGMLPLFRFSFATPDPLAVATPYRYYADQMDDYMEAVDNPLLRLTYRESDIPADSLLGMEREFARRIADGEGDEAVLLFQRAIAQSLVKQYTSAVNTYTEAIDKDPTNPFLYINRSATQSEMIDFISSIDNGTQRLTVETDPAGRLNNSSTRTYNYDEAIADLNKAAKLYPDFAYIYYNRANLQAVSGRIPEAYDDYSKAIELYPNFAEAYFNRGLAQIYLKDTRKGLLDISKAGELGIAHAYTVLKIYSYSEEE